MDKIYMIQLQRTVKNFLGYKINRKYDRGCVDISIPDYIRNTLKRLIYNVSITSQYSPHEHI